MRRFATAALLLLPAALGQDFEHRGFLDSQAFLFPQQAADDRAYVVAEGLFRYEASVEFAKAVRIAGELLGDVHHSGDNIVYPG